MKILESKFNACGSWKYYDDMTDEEKRLVRRGSIKDRNDQFWKEFKNRKNKS